MRLPLDRRPWTYPLSASGQTDRSAELAAELDQHPRQDPGDLHLGHADLLGDLRLGLLLKNRR